MTDSFKAFMQGLIDYAGLFPPADLSLEKAIRNYRQYLEDEDRWMLSRFILPAGMIEKLLPHARELFDAEEDPLSLSVLGAPTNTISEFRQQIAIVAKSSGPSATQEGGAVIRADLLEIKLPREVALSADKNLTTEVLQHSEATLSDMGFQPDMIYCEGHLEESWKMDIAALLEGIAGFNEGSDGTNLQAGFKLRCGGMEAHEFPTSEQVAFAINRAREGGVPLKCTAGLHHPVRHYNESVQTKMHGFLNVFGGALLAHANDLNDEELTEIIKEEDPEHFEFTDEAFRWMELEVNTERIAELRASMVSSFGSCSFDEPREDLRKMGLL